MNDIIGQKLHNGAIILLQDEATTVTLCLRHGEFVTWMVSEDGDAYWGHYHGQDLQMALNDYNARIGRRKGA